MRSGQPDLETARHAVIQTWRNRVAQVLAAGGKTPLYLFSPDEVIERAQAVESLPFGIPATCLLSLKTQPLPHLLSHWIHLGRPVEVVSEFEFRAALAEGCPADRLLVNGPAKHRWLTQVSIPELRVNFDSLRELESLLPVAKRDRWKVGLRIRTPEETDSENPGFPSQFGLSAEETREAVRQLRDHSLEPDCVHTHIRTSLPDPSYWARALEFVHGACAKADWQPQIVDSGGGLPAFDTRSRSGGSLTASYDAQLASYASHIRSAIRPFTNCRQLWLEHGRHLSAGSGVLVVRVLDIKGNLQHRSIICDGGRTLHALVSMWESHDLVPLSANSGAVSPSTVHGPTCMAFDQLGRVELPTALTPGDVLIWMEAGAYHLPWETRFSHGHCEVWWLDNGDARRIRRTETFEEFWQRWEPRSQCR